MLQSGEIVIILLLALIVLGPKRLPDMARKLGKWTRELRTAAREISRGLEAEVSEFKEVGRELRAPLDDVKKPFSEIRDDMRDMDPGRYEWKGPKPVSGPTPEEAMSDLEKIESEADGESRPAGEPDE